jgi:hypothetical protein
MDNEDMNKIYGMTTKVDKNGILTFENGTQYDLNEPKIEAEYGCSTPIRFNTSKGVKKMEPGKSYDENLNEISPIEQIEFKLAKKLRDFLKLDK